MGDREYHVASYVVSTMPGREDGVADRINAVRELEVHAQGQGKLVVSAEANSVRKLADLADGLAAMNEVINVAPVYHEYSGSADKEAEL